jgi:hypothetical protein
MAAERVEAGVESGEEGASCWKEGERKASAAGEDG